MTVKAANILAELVSEIDNWDPTMFPITQGKMCEHEVVLCTVDDDVLKKIWQLHLFYRREASRAAADLSINSEDIEIQKQGSKHSDKAELLSNLFWFMACEKYDIWGEAETGLRKDWEIVRSHSHGPDIIKQLFGGPGGRR